MSDSVDEINGPSGAPIIRRSSKRILDKKIQQKMATQTYGVSSQSNDFAIPKEKFFTAAFINNE